MATALITGANRGIGLGLAERLSERGYDVIGTTRGTDAATALAACARVEQLDVTDVASVAALRDHLVGEGTVLDVLVNNAGWAAQDYAHSLHDVDADVDRRAFDVNAIGTFRMLQSFAEVLADGAKVVNLSTRLASLTNTQQLLDPMYAASKAAVNMLTRQLAFDPAFAGKCLVAVSPGWVRTRMGGDDAALSVEESSGAVADLITALDPSRTGSFLNYDGRPLPW